MIVVEIHDAEGLAFVIVDQAAIIEINGDPFLLRKLMMERVDLIKEMGNFGGWSGSKAVEIWSREFAFCLIIDV